MIKRALLKAISITMIFAALTGCTSEREVTKKVKVDKASYDKFTSESYTAIFEDYINNTDKKNLIYSPYSYKLALEGLGSVTSDFDEDEYLGYAVRDNMPKELDATRTKTITMLNKNEFETKDKSINVVGFPDEAIKLSDRAKKEVFGEALWPSEYDGATRFAIMNATKFEAEWAEPFDKDMIEEDEFYGYGDGSGKLGDIVMKKYMFGEIDPFGYDDDDVMAGMKPLKDGKSAVYFIVPKDFSKDKITSIAANIPRYINKLNEHKEGDGAKFYDYVNIKVPIIEDKTEINVLKAELNAGHESLAKGFKVKDTIANKGEKELYVNDITQLARFKLDDKGVRAEAVTDIMEMTAMPNENPTELNIDCIKPFFVVVESEGVISFITFIGY